MRIVTMVASVAMLAAPFVAGTARAQCLSDVQADVRVALDARPPRFVTKLAPGDATLTGSVQRGRDTVRVLLKFDYRVPRDVIVFDEIVCAIEVLVEDAAGNEVARSDIDPNSIHLNPNRVPLYFVTTLYVGEGSAVRVRVRGNYE